VRLASNDATNQRAEPHLRLVYNRKATSRHLSPFTQTPMPLLSHFPKPKLFPPSSSFSSRTAHDRTMAPKFFPLGSQPTKVGLSQASTSVSEFHEVLKDSKRIMALCGAGLSAASGLGTFRGAGGMWRNYQATSLATPEAFGRDPGLVW
jgi:hypothetical protein